MLRMPSLTLRLSLSQLGRIMIILYFIFNIISMLFTPAKAQDLRDVMPACGNLGQHDAGVPYVMNVVSDKGINNTCRGIATYKNRIYIVSFINHSGRTDTLFRVFTRSLAGIIKEQNVYRYFNRNEYFSFVTIGDEEGEIWTVIALPGAGWTRVIAGTVEITTDVIQQITTNAISNGIYNFGAEALLNGAMREIFGFSPDSLLSSQSGIPLKILLSLVKAAGEKSTEDQFRKVILPALIDEIGRQAGASRFQRQLMSAVVSDLFEYFFGFHSDRIRLFSSKFNKLPDWCNKLGGLCN